MVDQLAVIFDMDGVLVDSEPWHYKVEELIFEELGIDVPDKVHKIYLGMAADLMWSKSSAQSRRAKITDGAK